MATKQERKIQEMLQKEYDKQAIKQQAQQEEEEFRVGVASEEDKSTYPAEYEQWKAQNKKIYFVDVVDDEGVEQRMYVKKPDFALTKTLITTLMADPLSAITVGESVMDLCFLGGYDMRSDDDMRLTAALLLVNLVKTNGGTLKKKLSDWRDILGEPDLKAPLNFERKNALMTVAYGGVDPHEWITENEDGSPNWDKWARLWTALEFKMGMDMEMNLLKMKAQMPT